MRPRTARRWSCVALCLAGLVLAQCSRGSSPTNGTISGVARPCLGTAPPGGWNERAIPVTVMLYQRSRVVARQIVKGSDIYRFEVPAGRYKVVAYPGSVYVTVRAGETSHANIYNPCG